MFKSLKNHSKTKLFVAGGILAVTLFFVLFNPRDKQFFIEAGYEVMLARKICENSVEWVETHQDRLKLSRNKLRDIPVDGKRVFLKHVKYPEIIFLHTGYKHKNANNELYCMVKDPRSTGVQYFFDYETQSWVNRARTKR